MTEIIIIIITTMSGVKLAGCGLRSSMGRAITKPFLYACIASNSTDFIIIIPENLPSNMRLLFVIIVQRDATQSSLFTILQVHSTCFEY